MDENQIKAAEAAQHDPIKQWFYRAGKAIQPGEEDQTVLGELGVELQKLLFEAVLMRNVGGVWLLYCQFMDVSRRQENIKDHLNWFREAPPRRWISKMTGRIDGAFVPGGVEDEERYVQKRLSNMPDGGARRELSAWLKKRIEEEPALIERQDHVTLTNLANQIRDRLCGAVLFQDHTLILAIFHKIEHDRHWWRTIWHDPIFNAWQREVSSMGEEEQE